MAGLFLMTATSRGDSDPLVIGIVVALVLGVAYFQSQQQVLELASAGTTIRRDTKGIELEVVKKFIDHVEAAKNERYLIGRKI